MSSFLIAGIMFWVGSIKLEKEPATWYFGLPYKWCDRTYFILGGMFLDDGIKSLMS